MRFLLLLLALPLWASEDVDAIIKRAIEAQRQNDPRAQQYTYVQQTEHFTLNKEGQQHRTSTATHEVIFVEGLRYQKLVARNGKPLTAKEQAQVEKAMQQTAEERRRHEHQGPAGGVVSLNGLFSHKSADLGSPAELLTLFDNRLAGEEEIRGHKTWVVESAPSASHVPASEHEKDVRGFRKKFWFDQQDGVPVRAVYTVAAEGMFLTPGSTITFDYQKIDPETWQPVSLVLEFSSGKEKVYRPTGQTVYHMDQFRKFDVQSTITVGPVDK
jgi:hypothetical protein